MIPEEFRQAIFDMLHIELTEEQMQQFAGYYELLIEGQTKLNLTAITERSEVYLKHFYDSLTVAKTTDLKKEGLLLCDVGAGAGFPSLPLKIVYPNLRVSIIDSLNKRIHFLQDLTKKLELQQVYLHHGRAEDFGQNEQFREKFDLVTARAVARLNVLSEFCLPLVKQEGLFIALKASKMQEELEEAQKAIQTLGGQAKRVQEIYLPYSGDERQLVIIEKNKKTPKKYPRKAGTPGKKPIV